MRRLWAFIIMLTTVVLSVVFIGQPIIEKTNFSSEFASGKEVVYQLTRREGGIAINPDKIGDNINDRLERAGIKNAHVEVVGSGDEASLRVGFVPKSASQFNEVKTQIQASGELSICTKDDYCLTGKDFFNTNDLVSLRYLGGSAYPGFNIKSKVAADSFYEKISSEENATAYIWQNYDPEYDSYEKAFGENPDEDVKAKVVTAVVWSGNYIEEDLRLYLTQDPYGQAFTLSSARAFANAYNNPDYGCNIKYLYTTNIPATFSSTVMTLTLVSIGVVIALIGVALIALFKGAGVINFISLIAVVGLQLLINAMVGFEFASASILAILLTVVLGLYNLLEINRRIKDELKKGRTISKAVAEGNRKSIIAVLDTCAVTLVVSLFAFLLGKGMIKTFGGTLFVGSILVFLSCIIINKWLTVFAASSPLANIGKKRLGLNYKENSENVFDKVNKPLDTKVTKKRRFKGLIAGGSLIAASVAVLLGFGLTRGVFVPSNEYLSTARIDLITQSDEKHYEDSYELKSYLLENYFNEALLGKEFEFTGFDFSRDEKQDEYGNDYAVTYASFKVDTSLLRDKKVTEVINLLTEDMKVEMSGSSASNDDFEPKVTIGEAKVVNTEYEMTNMLLILGLSVLFSSLYIFVRFGLSWFISHLLITAIGAVSMVAIFSALMLPFNIAVTFGMLNVIILMSFIMVPVFSRNREILKDQKMVKTANLEERVSVMDQAVKSVFNSYFMVGCTIAIASALIIAITTASIMLSAMLIFIISSLLVMFLLMYFAPSFYLFFRTHIKFKQIDWSKFKVKIKMRKPVLIDKNEPHETIVMGLNDFR